MYDTLIIGGGIAGLYVARELLKKNPSKRVVLCEKSKYLGGRAYTYHWANQDLHWANQDLHWEAGAGRISTDHKILLGLIKEYDLETAPIGSSMRYRENGAALFEENIFEPSFPILLDPLRRLSHGLLTNYTIKELLTFIHGAATTKKYLDRFPYYSEVNIMRAESALREFAHEMHDHSGFVVIKKGFSELIARMVKDLKKRGLEILTEHTLLNVSEGEAEFEQKTIRARRIIVALPADALSKIPAFKRWPLLDHVQMEPLLRIYAVFDEPWFHDIGRIATASPIRYFIPVGEKVAMISYTDSVYTRPYVDLDEKKIMKDLRELFPEKDIPDPLFMKSHYWQDGVTYWLPGPWEPEKDSVAALQPFPKKCPNLFLCGESFSLRQGWVEGALEHADKLLDYIR